MMEQYKKVADMLEQFQAKYNMEQADVEALAKACGGAIAENALAQVQEDPMEAVPAAPMDTGADELVGALGGRG